MRQYAIHSISVLTHFNSIFVNTTVKVGVDNENPLETVHKVDEWIIFDWSFVCLEVVTWRQDWKHIWIVWDISFSESLPGQTKKLCCLYIAASCLLILIWSANYVEVIGNPLENNWFSFLGSRYCNWLSKQLKKKWKWGRDREFWKRLCCSYKRTYIKFRSLKTLTLNK